MRMARLLLIAVAAGAFTGDALADEVRIGAWNIEWLGSPDQRSDTGRNVAQTGPDLAAYVHASKVDVLALEEIGDSDPSPARRSRGLDAMVASLATTYGQTWKYVLFAKKSGAFSPDTQLTGVAWNTGRVRADEDDVLRIPVFDNPNDDLNSWDRHPHAMRFTVAGSGRNDFVLIPLHMKANGRDPARRVRRQRAYEARVLVDRLSEVREQFADEDVVLLGDTNVLQKHEEAVRTFTSAGYRDLNSDDVPTYFGSDAPFDRIFVPSGQPEFSASRMTVFRPTDEARHRRLCSDHFLVYCDVAVVDDDDADPPDVLVADGPDADDAGGRMEPLDRRETHAASPANARVLGQLRATLWMQTAAEYRAASLQAYRLAGWLLPRALSDHSWTADVEQARAGDAAGKPPAIVLDLDETVLDNSPFQARILEKALVDPTYGDDFDNQEWSRWVEQRSATAVPGAVDFLATAARAGIAIYFITNRDEDAEPATLDNLRRLGIPATAGTVLSQGRGVSSDKRERRALVARTHRVVLLVGDDLNDFVSGVRGVSREQRDAVATAHEAWFGTRWITLPNAMYGSWWGTLGDEPERQLRRN